jgi:transitional endoplasmic reticulum ATPase
MAEDKHYKIVKTGTKDASKGIARMDPADMKSNSFETGEVIRIIGKKQAAAKVLPLHPGERVPGIIQIDGITCDNARISTGEHVKVEKTDYSDARTIKLKPIGSHIFQENDFAYLSRILDGLPLLQGNKLRINLFNGAIREYIVESTTPRDIVIFKRNTTKIRFVNKNDNEGDGYNLITYEEIGGLSKELQKIREMIELPLLHPEIFTRLGIDAPKGVLLYGPPGTGKTLIARAVAQETDATFIHVSGPEIMHKLYGESEGRLRELFEKAKASAPSILFLDEIDAIATKRDEVTGEVEKRVVAQLLASMDGIESRGQVIVIGATNIPDSLDLALRRPGRFDREIVIGVPGQEDRLEILQIHTRGMPLSSDMDLSLLAGITHGFVGADLQALCREAAFSCLREHLPEHIETANVSRDVLMAMEIKQKHFFQALTEVEPSASREVMVEIPTVTWDMIFGLDDIKKQLREAVEWPLKYPELFKQYGLEPYKGIMLYGPPGTGKTMLAKAVAHESELNFILVNGPLLLSKWLGETEKGIREVFRKAKQVSPCIIFFDEIDSLLPRKGLLDGRDRFVSQFLTEIDGLVELRGVFVLAATNRLDLIDPAVLRPGRFDLLIEIPKPDSKARSEMVKWCFAKCCLGEELSIENIVEISENWSGAELKALCRETFFNAIRGTLQERGIINTAQKPLLEMHHLEDAYKKMRRGEFC